MDTAAVLEFIASQFPSLPEPALESQLLMFDAMVGYDQSQRPAAAEMLRTAAQSSTDPVRRERLLKAADAVAAGLPCSATPEGFTAQQSAGVAADQWVEPSAPLPPPGDDEDLDEEDDEDPDDPDYMEEAPPKLPHLPVRHFFSGLRIRVARDFSDAQGRALCEGDVLKVLSLEQTDSGYLLSLFVRSVRLTAGTDAHDSILENAGNAWLQPVPTVLCLQDLREAIDLVLGTADEDEELDDDDLEHIEALRDDVEACEVWLAESGDRGPAPVCKSGPLAAKTFGRDHHLTFWIRLLFAGVALSSVD